MFAMWWIIIGLLVAGPAVYSLRPYRKLEPYLLPLPALLAFLVFLGLGGRAQSPGGYFHTVNWIDALDWTASLRLDGFSLLFALMITGIGALIMLYASSYCAHDVTRHRFYAVLYIFMASMLGLVLADSLILFFIFWELTSITSFFLIGHHYQKEDTRKAALQALLVTGAGGLALLAGVILLGVRTDCWSFSELAAAGSDLTSIAPLLGPILLIVVAAAAKSAQLPLHFWLPNAMQAPTPASAFLHSSTMVKAGVYLLARMSPVLGDHPVWTPLVTGLGAATMIYAGLFAVFQHPMKRLLAYSTISALGAMVMLTGLGSEAALKALVILIVAHACYKAALFMLAGAIDHSTGEKRLNHLRGLRRAMPWTFGIALLAGASLAGLPPFAGFLAKESILTSMHGHFLLSLGMTLAATGYVAAALRFSLSPFAGTPMDEHRMAHDSPRSMLAPPALLACTGLVIGLFPALCDSLVYGAVSALKGTVIEGHLHLWHGFNVALLLSLIAIGAGYAIWRHFPRIENRISVLASFARFGPQKTYQRALSAIERLHQRGLPCFGGGQLGHYLRVILLTANALLLYGLLNSERGRDIDFAGITLVNACLGGLIILAAVFVVVSRMRLAAICILGLAGYMVSLLFITMGAPDLALTQMIVESLTVILLILSFYHLPPLALPATWPQRVVDAVLATGVGVMMMCIAYMISGKHTPQETSNFYLKSAYAEAHGQNVVNVILVDFRGFDTLGEITVLVMAGLGVAALLNYRAQKREDAT
ncbi:MAG: multicomponent Na+:H+ antiporter subunit A [Candidatus Promineifilaceae bacterium]|jgi:multicomponent Na+:H+ antiporter subunit A